MQETPFKIGEKYFIRTVTYHLVGEVEKIVGHFIVFKEKSLSWIADSGRFQQAIDKGTLNEVEPINVSGGVNIDSIVDYFVWIHELPRKQQ